MVRFGAFWVLFLQTNFYKLPFAPESLELIFDVYVMYFRVCTTYSVCVKYCVHFCDMICLVPGIYSPLSFTLYKGISKVVNVSIVTRYIDPPPGGGCKALSVCLSARISRKPNRQNFIDFFCERGRDTIILWRQCDMLCTSGFVDDVMFSYNGSYGASCACI